MAGSFEAWMARVDAHVQRLAGVGYRDLADWQWYDAWSAGESPSTAARLALADELFG